MCRRLETADQQGSDEYNALVKGQEELDQICAGKALQTLQKADANALLNEPLLQLFYWRLECHSHLYWPRHCRYAHHHVRYMQGILCSSQAPA